MSEFIQKRRVGDILIDLGFITPENLDKAMERQKETKKFLGQILIEDKFITEEQLTQALAVRFHVEYVDLTNFSVNPDIFNKIPKQLFDLYSFVPYILNGTELTIVISDPNQIDWIDNIQMQTGFTVDYCLSAQNQITSILEEYFKEEEPVEETEEKTKSEASEASLAELSMDDIMGDLDLEFTDSKEENERVSDMRIDENSGPIIKMVNKIVLDALKTTVSDIHIEQHEEKVIIRYRLDGSLHDHMNCPKRAGNPMLSRIKIMSDLNIAEKRIPQDGAFSIMYNKKKVDFRVSILPSIHGENCVIRILSKENVTLDIRSIGFDVGSHILRQFDRCIRKPYGMILITGPTGSGKTTTLYSALSELNDRETKIITVEDPVEFQILGIHQTQVFVNKNEPERSLTFASGLRSILRQDPDVVMLGEIRDEETAEIAVNAALTGHLVFSTVHANNSVDVIGRLKNLAIEPSLLAAALNIIIAQRLLRRVCQDCKISVTEEEPVKAMLNDCNFEVEPNLEGSYVNGTGCDMCLSTGCRGRVPIFEVLEATKTIKSMIIDGSSALRIKGVARDAGMLTLSEFALMRTRQGMIPLDILHKFARGQE